MGELTIVARWSAGGRTALAALGLAFVLAACGNVDISWKEQVKLASGEVIVVKRTAQGKRLGEIGGTGGWAATRMTLEIAEPRRPTDPPQWAERWVPMLFDFDGERKEWLVVATFYMCEDWVALGRPKLPYVQYRAREGRWIQVPLEASLFGRQANLLTGPRASGEPALVTLEMIDKDRTAAAEMYQKILAVWPNVC
jgi:hypothetical protein